jgi:hypothetical protein
LAFKQVIEFTSSDFRLGVIKVTFKHLLGFSELTRTNSTPSGTMAEHYRSMTKASMRESIEWATESMTEAR